MKEAANYEVRAIRDRNCTYPVVLQILQVERLKTELCYTERFVAFYIYFAISQVFYKIHKCEQPLPCKEYNYLLWIMRQASTSKRTSKHNFRLRNFEQFCT
jgi:hypothetical protein